MRHLAATLLLCSCASTTHLRTGDGAVGQCALPVLVAVSDNLTTEEASAARIAVGHWSGWLVWAGRAPWAPDDADAPVQGVVLIGHPSRDYESHGAAARTDLGLLADGCIRSARVLLFEPAEGARGIHIIEHELGHVLGLAHAADGPMAARVGP